MKVKQLVNMLLQFDQEKDAVVSECGHTYQPIVGLMEAIDGNFDGVIVAGQAMMDNFRATGDQTNSAPV